MMRKTTTFLSLILLWFPMGASAAVTDGFLLGAARGVAGAAASEPVADTQGVPDSQEPEENSLSEKVPAKDGRAALEEDLFGGGDAEVKPSGRQSLEDDLFGGGGSANGREAREDDLFGGADEGSKAGKGTGGDGAAEDRESALFGSGKPALSRFDESRFEDPLAIGGQLYSRLQVSGNDETSAENSTFSAPTLFDMYLDGRPNDRVRAYLRGRLSHDFSVTEGQTDLLGQPVDATKVSLDQLWLKFDIAKTVYVTAGRQPIRWGTGRFWNPNDVLNQQARDPLAVYDERLGVGLVKLHLPLESLGLNIYAVMNAEGAKQLDALGGALRVEWLVGMTEISLTAAARKDDPVRLGLDLSAPVGPFDVWIEGNVRHGDKSTYWEGEFDIASLKFPTELSREDEWLPMVTAGTEIAILYSDQDSLYLGLEGFYNHAGYEDPALYPWLLFNGDFKPLYNGRFYGGAYVSLPQPGEWNDSSFTLSLLSNLSDPTFLTRLDTRVRVLTHLDLSFWGSVFFGEGEFRLGVEVPAVPGVPGLENGLNLVPPRFQAGMAAILRI